MRSSWFLPAALPLGVASTLLALACADGDPLGTGGSGGEGASTATTNPTTGSTTSSSTTTASSTSSTGGQGGAGGEGMGGMGGAGGSDPCAMGCPTNSWDVDGNPLTGECGCEYACTQTSTDSDPIDESFTDDNCDGGDGLVEQCVYVSASQGSNSNPGTRMAPMQTIAAAIAQAQTNGVPSVCLSGEIYNEAVTVVPGISIYGGFDQNDPDFKFRRKAGITTTVQAMGTVFNVPDLTLDTHLEGLTIVATTPVTPGASTYGVRMANGTQQATLYVRYNVIQVGAGAAGAQGTNGAAHAQSKAPNGNNGTNGCQGTNCGFGGPQTVCTEFGGKGGDGGYDSNGGQTGSPGSGGTSGGPGAGGSDCFGGGNDAGDGSSGGGNGSQGTSGTGGQALGTVAGGFYVPSAGQNGALGVNGKGGAGGGGGGGGDNAGGFCNSDKGGGGGSGGCGGLGGNLGTGGGGGGGSFGVFVAAGKVVVTDNEILSGAGGNGGNGGNGASGQTGGDGGSPGGGNDDSGSGGFGGPGSNGGAGGPGGGGGGGPSACLGRASAATFTFSSNSCTTGLPGDGGVGGTNPQGGVGGPGTDGTASPNLQIN
ncbi:MAG: PE-PGRS family protein [Myxococcales bacterium]|nr:PE-PGRS family protein [Myxococcales bacterium]